MIMNASLEPHNPTFIQTYFTDPLKNLLLRICNLAIRVFSRIITDEPGVQQKPVAHVILFNPMGKIQDLLGNIENPVDEHTVRDTDKNTFAVLKDRLGKQQNGEIAVTAYNEFSLASDHKNRLLLQSEKVVFVFFSSYPSVMRFSDILDRYKSVWLLVKKPNVRRLMMVGPMGDNAHPRDDSPVLNDPEYRQINTYYDEAFCTPYNKQGIAYDQDKNTLVSRINYHLNELLSNCVVA